MTAIKDQAALAGQGMTYLTPGPIGATAWVDTDHGPRVVRVDGKETNAMFKAERRGRDLLEAMAAGAQPFYEAGAYARGLVHEVDAEVTTRTRPGPWNFKAKGYETPAPIEMISDRVTRTIPFSYMEKIKDERIWRDVVVQVVAIAPAKRTYKRRKAA